MHVGVLGAAEVRVDGAAADLGASKQRALLAALALHAGRPVSADRLADLVWGEGPPPSVTASLQGYVARLRRALEPDRPPRAPSRVLVTEEGGYALRLDPGVLDVQRFEQAVAEVHRRLDPALLAARPGEGLEALHERLDDALALWRGTAYADLEDAPAAQADRSRLEELRLLAVEDRAAVALGLGRHATTAAELEWLTAAHPLRERLWGLRALALARCGRQADALAVLAEVRDVLRTELGLEPGAELRDLQTAVLRQDPALEWRQPSTVERPAREAGPEQPGRRRDAVPGWPLVGRDDELAALCAVLDESATHPAFAVLTGEPGIGKSRLSAELARVAEARGVRVLVGRCSQDDGASPLYPWASVLAELGHQLPSGEVEGEGPEAGSAQFRAREQIARFVLQAAATEPLLVVLDDLHWADASTLRVLRLLAETGQHGRLMVLTTWRPDPPPSGHLAEVAEMLARRHALRLGLGGLTADQAGHVVGTVTGTDPTPAQARALCERTDGNPFFLVEYARLATAGTGLSTLVDAAPPAGVHDVLTRRLATLPEETLHVLRTAGVLGRDFDVPALARVLARPEDDVIDALEPALRAGLVRESAVDAFRFAHALVRDTAYDDLSRSRRARVHVRAAEALADEPGREREVARHWLAAGPSYAGRAWRAARVAAEAARSVYAYDEAVDLLTGAVAAADRDPGMDDEGRLALLLDLARAHRRVDDLVSLRAVVHRALDIAEPRGDLDAQLEATGLLMTNLLWQAGAYGVIDDRVVATLRRCLDELPPGDSHARCRATVGLAAEMYYDSVPDERTALGREALAMARRLGDERLLLATLVALPLAVNGPSTAHLRLDLTVEAVELARALGDTSTLAPALALRATAAHELGRAQEVLELVAEAREVAVRERQLFTELVVIGIEVPWRAMRGELDALPALLSRMLQLHERTDVQHTGDAFVAALLMESLWAGDDDAVRSFVPHLDVVRVLPPRAVRAGVLARLGDVDGARAALDGGPLELSADWWFSLFLLAFAAEAALATGRPDLAAQVHAAMTPYAGRPAVAGSGACLGVVDSFLAMAAHAMGDRELATRHADDADRIHTEWQLPLAHAWFAGVRRREGF